MAHKKRAAVPKVVVADRRTERLYAQVKADLVATRKALACVTLERDILKRLKLGRDLARRSAR